MAGKTAILAVKIVSDAKQAKKEFEDTATGVEKFQNKVNAATPYAAAAGAAIVAMGKSAVDAASDLQQSSGAVQKVFGDQAATVEAFAKKASQSVGLSQSAYQTMASTLGSSLKNMGVPMSELSGQTNDLIQLGADLAATYGGTTSDAVEALTSLLRGETDPIERFGVSIKQSDINAQMAAMGLDGLTGAAGKNAQAQAILALLSKQTADAQGAFASETHTAAGAQQIATAKYEDAKAALGEALLPAYTALMEALQSVTQWVGQHTTAVSIGVGIIATLASGVLAANAALKVYQAGQVAVKAATLAWSGAQTVLNLALNANPIGIVVMAVAALAAGVVYAYKHSETFRGIVQGLWNKLKEGAGWLGSLFSPLVDGVQAAVKWVGNLAGKVKDLFSFSMPGWMKDLGNAVKGLFSAPDLTVAASLAPVAAPSVTGGYIGTRYRPGRDDGGARTIINVNGALDPVSVARQIRALLEQDSRRRGTVEIGGAW